MLEKLIFIAMGMGRVLPYIVEKKGGTRQGFQIPKAGTSMRQG